jgi:short-subunit dehydrogenase
MLPPVLAGASQGIGEMLSLYLAAQGAHLVLSARGKDKLEVRAAAVTHNW